MRRDDIDTFVRGASTAFPLVLSTAWGLGDQVHPLGEAALQREMQRSAQSTESFVLSRSNAWKEHCGCAVKGRGDIPNKVSVETPCGEICARCIGDLDAETVKLKQDLVKALLTVSKAARGVPKPSALGWRASQGPRTQSYPRSITAPGATAKHSTATLRRASFQ